LFLKVSDSNLKMMNSENEHRNEHRFDNPSLDFNLKKRYSIPKDYIPKTQGSPDLEKRWHVYFYWRTHKDGILDKKFTYTKILLLSQLLSKRTHKK
jgi:hypothetical protein